MVRLPMDGHAACGAVTRAPGFERAAITPLAFAI